MRKGADVNYWLLGLLIITNLTLAFYVFRAAKLSRALKRARNRNRRLRAVAVRDDPAGLAKKKYDRDMLALLNASPINGLERYARARLPRQKDIENFLPAVDCDLAALRRKKVVRVEFDADAPRKDMANHALRLQNWFVGKSELFYLNALCIAYLRRRSIHTDHARILFIRLWAEQGEFLASKLSSRWLLSALMTFMDHGETPLQRVIGSVGIAFGNSVKIYEWERVARGDFAHGFDVHEGLDHTIEGIPDVGRVSVANADIFRNMLASYVDLSLQDRVAGRVLITLLIRFHGADTIFSRLDEAKLMANPAPDAEIPQRRHWSFGRHPHEISDNGDPSAPQS